MKPRSAVAALLAVAETLRAAKAKAVSARQDSGGDALPVKREAKIVDCRPLFLRIKPQALS